MAIESVNKPDFGFARRQGAFVDGLSAKGDALVVAREPLNVAALAELQRLTRRPLRLTALSAAAYDAALEVAYQQSGDSLSLVADVGDTLAGDLKQVVEALPEAADLLESQDDAPIIRLLNAVLSEAIRQGASDIHIEPFENRLAVRFRVDGVLSEVMSPPQRLAAMIVSRIKVMARLDIAEKRLPQDGRMSLKVAGRPVDVRVSTLPSGHGERVVMRLLDKQAGRLDLAQLGMNADDQQRLTELIARPHGIILVTGPTGSGKTTTLYAALQKLNDSSRNIMTVEDPIEYYIDGIGQTQVNSKVNLSFARGLRAILRQDPDVVMVGEIRDLETAQIAVQASLTGHLVLSTLHTNTAVGAIARLRDMGIEPFLLASSLIGVVAQRLVRCLDPEFSESYEASEAECAAAGLPATKTTLWRPRGDSDAGYVGYRGRTGLYEILSVDQALREAIHEEASESTLIAASEQHTHTLLEDGWEKASTGVTSLEEVLRVTRER